jgi:hypothetical protein
MMEDMEYEFLIRNVYHCGRNASNGADADIYRDMEHAHTDLTNQSMYATQSEREYEYRKCFAKVRRHVDDAIREGIKQIKYKAETADVEKLQTMTSKLNFDFYNKDELDKIIDEANNIFHKYGLEEG